MSKVAVILWMYHTDLWDEFFHLLKPLSSKIHLYLGLPNTISKYHYLFSNIKSLDQVSVSYHDNYGADVAPFLRQIQNVSEPFFIKLHSKKSLIGNKHIIQWREVLVHNLIGSSRILEDNIRLFSNPSVGMIGPGQFLAKKQEAKNSDNIKHLCKIINIDYDLVHNSEFIAGNMFMSRTHPFQNIFDSQNTITILSLLAKETGKIDDLIKGTYTHALERLFGYLCALNDTIIASTEPPTILIKNDQAPDGFFHLVNTYNNYCYLAEDINVFGKILDSSVSHYNIEWYHMTRKTVQKYHILKTYPQQIISKA